MTGGDKRFNGAGTEYRKGLATGDGGPREGGERLDRIDSYPGSLVNRRAERAERRHRRRLFC